MRLGLAFGLFALAATAFGDSIVVNGDFGTGDLTGWTVGGASNNDPWVINGSAGAFFVSEGCETDICINGTSAQQNNIDQILATNPGDTYTLSFSYNPDINNNPAEGPSELLVQFDGNTAIDLVNGTLGLGQTAPANGYNTYTITGLTASTGSTELNFLGRQDPSFDGLTNITVTDNSSSAPEPASYLMAAIGFIALGAGKLRARRR